MDSKRIALVCVSIGMLIVPAMALAGKRPPEGATYTKTGTSNIATTKADKDGNSAAEKVDLSVAAYECGNGVPIGIDGVKINKKGKYKFAGKAKNLAGQKVNLKVVGTFKSAKKLVQKTTVYKGNCEATDKVVMKRQ